MKIESKIFAHTDWLLLSLYAGLVIFGWFNIHAVSYTEELGQRIFSLSKSSSRQLIWIIATTIIFFVTFLFDGKIYQSIAYLFYAFTMLLLLSTLVWGVGVGGHRAWLQWGGQPSELAKLSCALAIAKYLDSRHVKLTQFSTQLSLLGLIFFPVAIILLQGDAGSGLVFAAFFIAFYREGLSPWPLLIAGGIVGMSVATLFIPRFYLTVSTISVALLLIVLVRRTLRRVIMVFLVTLGALVLIEGFHTFVEKMLKPHQQNRLKALVNPGSDPLGIGWNVTQSKIAIGSGGLWGKGFLQGTQTKYGFVPEQRTDFIFCTIGEEHGWVGSVFVISLFLGLISRILYLAERQRLRFARVYGYSVAAVLFFHFMVNIGMTIGLMPVIGIPLPFISYGGSSLWSFSLMLFILLKLDAERQSYVSWQQASIIE